MKRLMISEIIELANTSTTADDAVFVLRKYDCVPLRDILRLALSKEVEFDLPEGAPPFQPNEFDDRLRFYSEARKLKYFVKGEFQNINRIKREQMFIDLLESIHPDEAKLLIDAKDKKPIIKKSIVTKAFPELL